MSEDLHALRLNIFYEAGRQLEAQRLAERLKDLGAVVDITEVNVDPLNSKLRGKIYYFRNTASYVRTADQLAKTVSDMEALTPYFYDSKESLKASHSIWLVGKANPTALEAI